MLKLNQGYFWDMMKEEVTDDYIILESYGMTILKQPC